MRRTARTLLNFAFLFALAIWGGMVFFFTFQTTPVVFDALDRDTAARLLGQLFPRYFAVQLVCIVVALTAAGARLVWGGPRRLAGAATAFLAVALAITLYANISLLPRMVEAQGRVTSFVTTPKEAPERVAYGKLHGQAMVLNAIAALLGGVTLALAAFEPRLLAHGSTERGTRHAAQGDARRRDGPAEAITARVRP